MITEVPKKVLDLDEALGLYMFPKKVRSQGLTLAQVGRLKYEQRRYQEAISALSRAASIFEELESPYLELAIKDLDSIKEEIGEEKFNEVIQESNENK